MTAFPSIVPSARSRGGPAYAVEVIATITGQAAPIRLGNLSAGDVIDLTLSGIDEATVHDIREHFEGQFGRVLSFALSASVINALSDGASLTPTGCSWVYDSVPEVEDMGIDWHSMRMNLRLVHEPPAT